MLVTCTGCRGRAVGLQLDAEGLCGHCHRVRHGTAQAAQRKQLLSTTRKRGAGSLAAKPATAADFDDSDDDSDDSDDDKPAAKPAAAAAASRAAQKQAAKPPRRSCVDDPFPVCDPARGVRLDAARSSLPDAGDAGAFSSLPAEQHGQSAVSGRGRPSGRPASTSGARAGRLQSHPCARLRPFRRSCSSPCCRAACSGQKRAGL